MRPLILTLAIVAIVASPIVTRAEDAKPTATQRETRRQAAAGARMNADERLKKMTEKLGLSQEQQEKIKAIMAGGRGEFGKLRDLPEDQRRTKMREAFKAQQDKINEVLTPEQKEKYQAAMQNRRQSAGEAGGRKRGESVRKPEEKK